MRNLKEETFYLASYFDSRMMGLDDNYQTSDATEAEDWAWEHLNQGGYVEIKNQKTGKEVYLDPDDLLDDYSDYASGAFEDAINDSGVLEEDMGREIKRYSDVYSDERRNQGWWYFTTHGVQPGSVPKGVNILEVRDTPNGTYFRADAILNTSELEYYDIKERVPKQEESLKESSGKVYVVKTLQDYPYNGWVELMDKVDKNGEGEKHRFTDRDEVRKYAQELADQGYSNWQGYPSAEKKPANTKINIRESLNKYDLRTDNKYDLRNLYDACIMTDKEKRIIAEMIAKNARANVLYEALMNKFEGKSLVEADEYVQLADMPRKERHKEEYTVTIWDSVPDRRKEFFDSLDDAIECAWEAMTNGLYAKIEGAGQRVMLSPQEVLSGYDCVSRYIQEVFDKWEVESLKESADDDLLSSCKEKYRRLIDIADSASDFSSIKEVITAMFNEVGGRVRFEEVSRRYASFSGGVNGYSLWNSVSLEYEHADLHRLAEDLTMAFYRTSGGQGYNTYTLMDKIRGTNESLKESLDPNLLKNLLVNFFNSDFGGYGDPDNKVLSVDDIITDWRNRVIEIHTMTFEDSSSNFYKDYENYQEVDMDDLSAFLRRKGSDADDHEESLKEGVNDRLRQIAEPLANALDDLTDRDDGFYITYSIGMDDTGAVTGGVDFELFKSSRTEEEAKAEIERVFDENGFELDRRFKTNPGKTLFGRTHYQIIERDTK